jgi:MOSC domain-containing protein YiiM
MLTLRELIDTMPQAGVVEWIGLRPSRREVLRAVANADATIGHGLVGDHYSNRGGKRQVTLIQAEHLQAIASMLDVRAVDPGSLRRNLVICGINLLALKDKQFQVGDAILEYSGLCHPCSRMESALGPGGYNALRGHGGITARVLRGGTIRVGNPLTLSCVKLASTSGHT